MAPMVKFVLVLSENWTMTSGRDLSVLVRWAREAEDAGLDAVMLSEHVVLGPAAGADGVMANPREYALPGNQPPATPWPSSLLLLAAIAAVTDRVRLAASAVISPLRHPLLLAKEFATLDALSVGRLVVQPTVSWHRDEYAALGVPFSERGARLDEQLSIWAACWRAAARDEPISHGGRFYSFDDVWVAPGPARSGGPQLWFGGETLHDAVLRRLVGYGHGYNPLGRPPPEETDRLAAALAGAGRSIAELELIGGTRVRFPDGHSCADLGEALDQLPGQVAQGFGTFCIKPSQFIDDPDGVGAFCRDLVRRADLLFG
jgi:alkanesulfonate monooxygenase SsuD/methylene tetrahydromethanopterin reductase-like flavin-dependent oxidoreductase (luciferase family)